MNKKQFNSISEEVRLLYKLWEEMKFLRYTEKDFTKDNYYKKIIMKFPNKFEQHIYLTRKDYEQWRNIFMEKWGQHMK